jgi:antitoxin (DNA-binding transcriptional repressor) of toxin-antitoxin stability system
VLIIFVSRRSVRASRAKPTMRSVSGVFGGGGVGAGAVVGGVAMVPLSQDDPLGEFIRPVASEVRFQRTATGSRSVGTTSGGPVAVLVPPDEPTRAPSRNARGHNSQGRQRDPSQTQNHPVRTAKEDLCSCREQDGGCQSQANGHTPREVSWVRLFHRRHPYSRL